MRKRRRPGSILAAVGLGLFLPLGWLLAHLPSRIGLSVGSRLDQSASRAEGVFAPFFGIPASTSRALALISLRMGAPVVPIFIRRVEGGRHRVAAEPAIPVPETGDLTDYTAVFNRSIEAAIRQAPEQWFRIHRRWKTEPGSETA